MSKKQNFLIGAALAGLAGTLTTLLVPKKPRHVRNSFEASNSYKNWMWGSLTGGLVGVTTALLFAPKSGKNLVKDIAEPFLKKEEKVRKSTKTKAKHANSTHSKENHSHSNLAKEQSPPKAPKKKKIKELTHSAD